MLVSIDATAVMDHCVLDEMAGELCAVYIDARVATAVVVFFDLKPRITSRQFMGGCLRGRQDTMLVVVAGRSMPT